MCYYLNMKDRVFRDPVHGLIEFRGDDRPIAEILETRAFQRLRRIKQMGFAGLVYPGAEHSRFGHALGAFHIACRISNALKLDPEIGFHVKVAALVHDIGHGPFSHSWEQVFANTKHEAWGRRIASEDDEFATVLRRLEPGLPETLRQFWDKTYSPIFANKLISSQLDVDRLDYLLRDGHYSGAGYATYDLDWIIHALKLEPIHRGADPIDLVVDYRRGMFAVEQYLFARSYMYAQVYHHKTVRAAEWMFVKLFRRFADSPGQRSSLPGADKLCRGENLSVAEYLSLDDVSVTMAIDQWAGMICGVASSSDPVIRDLSQRFAKRRLFKTIELGDDPGIIPEMQPRVDAICREHFGDSAKYYYEFDCTEQVGYVSGRNEELHVVGHPRHGTVVLGRLLDEVPLGRTKLVRLVCAPEVLEPLMGGG